MARNIISTENPSHLNMIWVNFVLTLSLPAASDCGSVDEISCWIEWIPVVVRRICSQPRTQHFAIGCFFHALTHESDKFVVKHRVAKYLNAVNHYKWTMPLLCLIYFHWHSSVAFGARAIEFLNRVWVIDSSAFSQQCFLSHFLLFMMLLICCTRTMLYESLSIKKLDFSVKWACNISGLSWCEYECTPILFLSAWAAIVQNYTRGGF